MTDSIYKTYKPEGGGSGLFLKLNDGDSVKLRIASEPAAFTQEFTDSEGKTTVSTRFAWIVWNRGEKKAQIFNGGKSVFNQIANLFDEWGDPQDFDITVKRTGTQLDTRYSVTPSPKSVALTDAEQTECASIDLPKLVKGYWLKDFEDNKRSKEEFGPEDIPDFGESDE